jgi:hypothetical protein
MVEPAASTSFTLVSLECGTLVAAGGVADMQAAIDVASVVDLLHQAQGPTATNIAIAGSQQVSLRVPPEVRLISNDGVVMLDGITSSGRRPPGSSRRRACRCRRSSYGDRSPAGTRTQRLPWCASAPLPVGQLDRRQLIK